MGEKNSNTMFFLDELPIDFNLNPINFEPCEVDSDLAFSKEEISDYITKFFSLCSGCGKCCTDVLMLTNQEISKIRKYIKSHNIKPINRNTIFDKKQKNICPFLSKENRCLIYPVRPEICQKFYCSNSKENNALNSYEQVKVISMIQTFYPQEYITNSPFDLTYEQKRLKNYQKSIYKK